MTRRRVILNSKIGRLVVADPLNARELTALTYLVLTEHLGAYTQPREIEGRTGDAYVRVANDLEFRLGGGHVAKQILGISP